MYVARAQGKYTWGPWGRLPGALLHPSCTALRLMCAGEAALPRPRLWRAPTWLWDAWDVSTRGDAAAGCGLALRTAAGWKPLLAAKNLCWVQG